jgi:tetratricopeptide (TPR) repeat protein
MIPLATKLTAVESVLRELRKGYNPKSSILRELMAKLRAEKHAIATRIPEPSSNGKAARLEFRQAIRLHLEKLFWARMGLPQLVPSPSGDPPQPRTPEETERMLFAALDVDPDWNFGAYQSLVIFYGGIRRFDRMLQTYDRFMRTEPCSDAKAKFAFTLGEIAECVQDYERSIRFYSDSVALHHSWEHIRYYANNNLGYCLNTVGRFAEAEPYCRTAISNGPTTSNAYKNLGISLEGQGRLQEAVETYILGTQADSGDNRSFLLLHELLKREPSLAITFKDEVARCAWVMDFTRLVQGKCRNMDINGALSSLRVNYTRNARRSSEVGARVQFFLGAQRSPGPIAVGAMLRGMTGGSATTSGSCQWNNFIDSCCSGRFLLAICFPSLMSNEQVRQPGADPFAFATSAIRRIKGNTPMPLFMVAEDALGFSHHQEWLAAGADAILPFPVTFESLADAIRERYPCPEVSAGADSSPDS